MFATYALDLSIIKSTVRSQSIGHSQFDDVSTTVSFLRSTNKLAKLKGALNESSKLETAVRPLEFFAFTVYIDYLKYWYPSRVYDIVNMIYQAQNILLPMAVAKLTHNLAGSLSAHCVRIPALVQTTSFPWETITIHLFLGASRRFSNSQSILAVQCSLFLFTQKWESLYLVSEFQCTPPQASSKRNECSYSLNFILLNIKLIFLKFLAFHINAFGDTRPASLASEKKPLSAPTRTLTCNSPRQLGNNWTCIAMLNICNSNVCFDIL